MSLFSSIQMAGATLRADEIGLQVVGQNLANANTPGYIREDLTLVPAPTQTIGGLSLGMGVEVDGITQKIDKFLEDRLRGAMSDDSSAAMSQNVYSQLEGLIGALGSNSLSTLMGNFTNSINDVLNQPESLTVRNSAVLQGQSLAKGVIQLSSGAQQLRSDINKQVSDMAGSINSLIEQIRMLNLRIADAEGGGTSKSAAVGLRDQRGLALQNLAKLIDIRVAEQTDGTVTVFTGGNYLVTEGSSRKVEVVLDASRGGTVSNIQLASTNEPLNPASGQLRGLLDSRDTVLGGFLDNLDGFAQNLASTFNKIYASGQGLNGFTQCTSQNSVDDANKPLDATGLTVSPKNGSFQILVHDKSTGLTQATDINVNLNGTGHETTLSDLRDQLNKVNGISATISDGRGLVIKSTSPADQEFAFANDTSDVLASLGLNTFFTGSGANDLGVNADVIADPGKFAASSGGIGADTNNAVALAQFTDQPIASQNGATLVDLYDRLTGDVTQASNVAAATADGAHSFEETLRAQELSTSGVNIDEEAVKMMAYQQSYAASAKYITTLSSLFDILTKL